MCATQAELLAGKFLVPTEVDAFSTAGADDAIGFVTGQFGWIDVDAHAIDTEQTRVIEFAIREHLLFAFAFDFGVKLASEIARSFKCDDADAGILREIDEGSGHFAPVAEFQGAFAEAAPGDHADGVGGAAVDLDEGDEALAVGTERIFDTESFEAEEGHAHAEDLAGAYVAVGGFGALKEALERIDHPHQIRAEQTIPASTTDTAGRSLSTEAGFGSPF